MVFNLIFNTKKKRLYFVLLLFFFAAILWSGCKEKRHHLIEDVTQKVRHEKDTVGWNHVLQGLHGVWVHRKYLHQLDKQKSIYAANALLGNNFSVINLDTRQFLSDSLPFVAINANDSRSWGSCVYFGKKSGQVFMEVETKHPVFSGDEVVLDFSLDTMEFDTYLVLEQEFGEIRDKERYVKITEDVSAKVYDYEPLIGIEVYMRQYLTGVYQVYDANNGLVMRQLVFNPDGTLSNHPFAKYRMLAWHGFDALMIEGMTFLEEQLTNNNKYFGLKIKGNGLELYRIVKNKKEEIIMGDLLFRLKKPGEWTE